MDELIDRFGDPKKPVMNLIDIAQLKALCSRLAIDYVTCKGASLVMRFSISAEIDFVSVLTAVKRHPELQVNGTNPPSLVFTELGKAPDELLADAVGVMLKVTKDFEALTAKEPETKEEA